VSVFAHDIFGHVTFLRYQVTVMSLDEDVMDLCPKI
jgi:hypothetical protein